MRPFVLAATLSLIGSKATCQLIRLADKDGYLMVTLDTRSRPIPSGENMEVYWVRSQQLFITQGGAGGTLLHGQFRAYHPNGQLRALGELRRGLKHGEWRSWSPEGRLIEVQRWRRGVPVNMARHEKRMREGRDSTSIDPKERPSRTREKRHRSVPMIRPTSRSEKTVRAKEPRPPKVRKRDGMEKPHATEP